MINKKMIFFLLILVSVFVVSNVSAADNSDYSVFDNATDIEMQSIDETVHKTLGVSHNNDESADEDALEVSKSNDDELDNNAEDYRNIQTLIDNSVEGQVIHLNGTYLCDYLINVNKTVTIRGDGDGAVIKLSDEYQVYNTPFFSVSANNVIIENLKFVGGLFMFGGSLTWQGDYGRITSCEFNDNIASSESYGIGGAILLTGKECILENSIFKNNHAYQHGGAVLWYGNNGIIRDCLFTDNKATGNKGWGGALMLYADNCVVSNCEFINNTCTDYGGAIATHNQSNKISNCHFEDNRIINNASLGDVQGGAAIFSTCYDLIIDSCNFTNNRAEGALGGALSLTDNNTVTRSYFKGNLASMGNDILAFKTSTRVSANHFVLDFNETKNQAVYGISPSDLERLFNTFEITKIDSVVSFSAGMVFYYAQQGSIGVSVEGGILELSNIKVLKHPEANINYTDNLLTVSGLGVGEYILTAKTTPDENHNAVEANLTITVKKSTAAISASKVTVALKKSTLWSIKLVDSKTKKPIVGMKLTLKVYTGKKYKTVHVTTNSKGIASYQTKNLAQGSHNIVVSGSHSGYSFNTLKSSIKVIKPTPLIFKVNRENKKDGSTLSIIVLKKSTKKPVNGIKVQLCIYTGKTYKKITLKTKTDKKSKGVCGYGTNTLSVGTHKVVISPVDIKYSGSATSSMVIKSSAKKVPKWTHKIG